MWNALPSEAVYVNAPTLEQLLAMLQLLNYLILLLTDIATLCIIQIISNLMIVLCMLMHLSLTIKIS